MATKKTNNKRRVVTQDYIDEIIYKGFRYRILAEEAIAALSVLAHGQDKGRWRWLYTNKADDLSKRFLKEISK